MTHCCPRNQWPDSIFSSNWKSLNQDILPSHHSVLLLHCFTRPCPSQLHILVHCSSSILHCFITILFCAVISCNALCWLSPSAPSYTGLSCYFLIDTDCTASNFQSYFNPSCSPVLLFACVVACAIHLCLTQKWNILLCCFLLPRALYCHLKFVGYSFGI